MYLHFTRCNIWAIGNKYNFSSRVKTRYSTGALIFTFSGTQVRIAEHVLILDVYGMSRPEKTVSNHHEPYNRLTF